MDRPTASSGSEAAVNQPEIWRAERGKEERRRVGRLERKRESGEGSTSAADQSANEE